MTACLSFHWHCVLELGHLQKIKLQDHFWMRKWPTSLGFLFFLPVFFCVSFFSCSYLFAAVVDLLLGLLLVQKFQRKHHQDRTFLVDKYSQRRFCWLFFTQISEHLRAYSRLTWSLWSGYHWKGLFLLQNLSIDDAKFSQRWRSEME